MKVITVKLRDLEAARSRLMALGAGSDILRDAGLMPKAKGLVPVEYIPATKGEKVASPYKFSHSSPSGVYAARRRWLAGRISAASRILDRYGRAQKALGPEVMDSLDSLEQDLIRLEADDLLKLYRASLQRYVDSLTARQVGGAPWRLL